MRRPDLLMLLIISLVVTTLLTVQPTTCPTTADDSSPVATSPSHVSRFDSPNMTIILVSPANQSKLVGVANITLFISSVNGQVNLTLYVQNQVFPDYNRTLISPGFVSLFVNTTILAEGYLNFTILLEDMRFVPVDRESYYLRFLVDNHGPPSVELIYPTTTDTLTGVVNLTIRIISDYTHVYMNITVAGRITPEFNSTLVPVGLGNFTLNCSRYDNGVNILGIKVWTEEGLSAYVERSVNFLDHVRLTPLGLTYYSVIKGNQEIRLIVETPYPNVTVSLLVDGVVAPDVDRVVLSAGIRKIYLNTTPYREGEHNITYVGSTLNGHNWTYRTWYVIDNHGQPRVSFVFPRSDVVYGLATFRINIDSTWQYVNLTVYVDNVPVEGLVNVTVPTGEYSFFIDVGMYSKWEHTLKVVVTTEEGVTAEASRVFGFASFKPEDMVSLLVVLGIAFAIPVMRWRKGQPVRTTIIVDIVFICVTLALFVAVGVTSVALVLWHLNMASIWSVGAALIATNLILPLFESTRKETSE
ncbi:MAG: hypothetical protein QXS20_08810 [Candidatus Thorarchaeota archaeon]